MLKKHRVRTRLLGDTMRTIGWKIASSLLVVVLAALFGQPAAFAQSGATGAVTGTVLDSSGGVIPGAEIQIIEEDRAAAAQAEHRFERELCSDTASTQHLHRRRQRQGIR